MRLRKTNQQKNKQFPPIRLGKLSIYQQKAKQQTNKRWRKNYDDREPENERWQWNGPKHDCFFCHSSTRLLAPSIHGMAGYCICMVFVSCSCSFDIYIFDIRVFGSRVTFPSHTYEHMKLTWLLAVMFRDWGLARIQRRTQNTHTLPRPVTAAGLIDACFLLDWLSLFPIRRWSELVDVEFFISISEVWYLFFLGNNLISIFVR